MQVRASQMAVSVLKRMARAWPFFRIDRFATVVVLQRRRRATCQPGNYGTYFPAWKANRCSRTPTGHGPSSPWRTSRASEWLHACDCPPALHPALATAIAVQLGHRCLRHRQSDDCGARGGTGRGGVFLGVATVTLYQFRRINGVRVDGLASQIVLGSGATPTLAYVGAFAAATWAAFDSRWWLVTAAAVAGGIGYAFGVLRWWHAYQHDPARHVGGATPRVLAALAVLACLGLVALMIAS